MNLQVNTLKFHKGSSTQQTIFLGVFWIFFLVDIFEKQQETVQQVVNIFMTSYSEFFWSLFSLIRTEYEEIPQISPYSVQMRENTDQKNSEHGPFSGSDLCYALFRRYLESCQTPMIEFFMKMLTAKRY